MTSGTSPSRVFPPRFSRLTRRLRVAAAAIALLAVSAGGGFACGVKVVNSASSATSSNMTTLIVAGIDITLGFNQLIDSLTKLANQGSNNDQNFVQSLSALADKEAAQDTAETIGETIATEVAPEFMPSRVVCGQVSNQRRAASTLASYNAARGVAQTRSRNFSTNAPGSMSEKGTQGAIEQQFQQRCGLYANAATMSAPAGMCAAAADPKFTDLDIQPWKAILDPITFQDAGDPSDAYGSPGTKYRDAALDAVRMLTDVTPPDPLKGAALSRTEGQNLHVLRMRDVTRMNLARGVLEDMVAMRVVPDAASAGGAGGDGRRISRLGRYIELLTGNQINGNSLQGALPVVMAAGETENAAVQSVMARLSTQQALIFELMRVTEQIVSMEAVELAIKVEGSRAGNTSVANRTLIR